MSAVVGRAVLALGCFVAGGLLWTAGRLEQHVADGARHLATLENDTATTAADDIQPSRASAWRLPWVADRLAEMRWQRVARQYFLSSDAVVMPERLGDALAPTDSRIQFLLANVEFHAARRTRGDRQTLLRKLDGVIKSYTDTMKSSPGNDDAAYNFELAARTRQALAKRPRNSAGAETIDDEESNGPPGKPPLHGKVGEAPPQAQMKQFNLLVPQRPDERRERDAGKGAPPARKG